MSTEHRYQITQTWWENSEDEERDVERCTVTEHAQISDARDRWWAICNGYSGAIPHGRTRVTVSAVHVWRITNDKRVPHGELDGTYVVRFGWPKSPVDDLEGAELRTYVRNQLRSTAIGQKVPT